MIKTSHSIAQETSQVMEGEGWPKMVVYPVMFIIIFITILVKKVKGSG